MKIVAAVLLLITLAGCGAGGIMAGRNYHAWDSFVDLGYKDTQLNENTFKVSYAGYGIPSSLAEEYAMLRAAELTVQKGFKYFNIVDERSSSTTQTYLIPQQTSTRGTITATSSNTAVYSGTTTGGIISASYDRPIATIVIAMTNSQSPSSVDANIVYRSLSSQHGVTK